MDENSTLQKWVAEAIGTGLLVFIGVGSVAAMVVVNGDQAFRYADLGVIALAFGTIVVAMVYGIGHISGCHINPVVTIAFAATGGFPWRDVPGYLVAQIVGGVLGALAIIAVLGADVAGIGVPAPNVGPLQAGFAEMIAAAILVFAVFGAVDGRAPGGFAGLSIGLVVLAIILVVAPSTQAHFNSARTFGPMLAGELFGRPGGWVHLGPYVIGQIVGGVLGGLLYTASARTRRVEPEPVATQA